MCKSVRGAAFMGSSIHVVAAFVFLFWFLFDTVITEVGISLWKCDLMPNDLPKKRNLLVQYLNLLFKFFYYVFLCITGIYIFRGVERSSPRIIKFALLVFVIVQIISLGLFIAVQLTQWDNESNELESIGLASSFVGEEVLFDDGHVSHEVERNASSEIEFESDFVPVLESPLTSSTTTPDPIMPPEETPTDVVNVIGAKVPPVWRRPSHNQQVEIVFIILLAGFNFVGSSIYIGILLAYLLTL